MPTTCLSLIKTCLHMHTAASALQLPTCTACLKTLVCSLSKQQYEIKSAVASLTAVGTLIFKMLLLVLVFTLLVAHGTAVSATEESGLVIMTANQLRKAIKSQLNEALTESLPDICSFGGNGIQSSSGDYTVAAVMQELTDCINDTITDLLAPVLSQLSHLVTPGLTPSHPATSCMEILQLAPKSPSGLYWIRANEHDAKHMYCDMEKSCKGVAGGWMKIVSVNMTDGSCTCPPGLRTLQDPQPLCAINTDIAGCSSTVFPVQGIQYSRVCGKIIGYQQKSTDAFFPYNYRSQTTIDSYYVDGISLTHGSPRKHIWTFAAALHEYNSDWKRVCPCTNTRNTQHATIPSFVGQDYFCDTGSENNYQSIFYGDDPLWDGEGCGEFNTCCSWNTPPWFMKQLSSPTSDDIEMRLCADENRSDEDITVESLEIYVQ